MSRYLFVVNRLTAQKPTFSTTYLMAALVRQGAEVWAVDLDHLTWDSRRGTVASAWRLPDWARQPFAVCRTLGDAAAVAGAERQARQRTANGVPMESVAPPGNPDPTADFELPPGRMDDEAAPENSDTPTVPDTVPAAVAAEALPRATAKPGAWTPLPLASVDAAWLRCNFHAAKAVGNPFLGWAQAFEATGKLCFNAPAGLWRTTDKSHLFDLPSELRPRGLLSSNRADLLACIRFLGRTVVLKPSSGFGGEQVFIVERGRFDNLNAILDTLLASGPVMVQEYLQAAADGDRRVLLWQGRPIEIAGHTTIYRRMRPPGDLRNNLHIGGIRARCRFNAKDAAVIDGVGDFVRKHGIWLAGVDIIGGKVLEINACAPGGIHNINELYGIAVDDWIAQAATQAVVERAPAGSLHSAG
ncbi:MAG TPA: hypothetical protein VL860_02575 [Planctomycetota bacterium]|nr:hypothetical protein [Planctomycetota bacterium]